MCVTSRTSDVAGNMRAALCCVLLLVGHHAVLSSSRVRKFPDKFLFGASTSAYQVEGGWNEDGKASSIWDTMSHMRPSPIQDFSTGDVAANSYHLYKRDIEMLNELGVHFYRFSISWPRILPNGFANRINQAGIDYYNKLINEMLKSNIMPLVTMYHWDLPQNLQQLGGWANPEVVDWFVGYAKVLIETFGDRVKMWTTINEPYQICHDGYGSPDRAPMLNMSGIAEYLCSKNLLLAHAKVYRLYDEQYRKTQNGTVGISISCDWIHPASNSYDDYQAAIDARQFVFDQYAYPIFSKDGDYPAQLKRNIALKSAAQGFQKSRLPVLSAMDITLIRGSADFYGLNTYRTNLAYRDASVVGMYAAPSFMDDMNIAFKKNYSWPQGDPPWLKEAPWGFYNILRHIKEEYDNPTVYVTENGLSTGIGLLDDDRVRYYRSYLNAMLDAIADGCNVKAYTAWSLMDNFEWGQGYTLRFGLYEVDFSSPERTRTPRKSAFVYKEIIRTNTLDPNYMPEDYFIKNGTRTSFRNI